MKRSHMLRAAALLCAFTAASAAVLPYSLAKYTASAARTQTASVARWGVSFGALANTSSITVDYNTGANTKRGFPTLTTNYGNIGIVNSQVSAKYSIEFTSTTASPNNLTWRYYHQDDGTTTVPAEGGTYPCDIIIVKYSTNGAYDDSYPNPATNFTAPEYTCAPGNGVMNHRIYIMNRYPATVTPATGVKVLTTGDNVVPTVNTIGSSPPDRKGTMKFIWTQVD